MVLHENILIEYVEVVVRAVTNLQQLEERSRRSPPRGAASQGGVCNPGAGGGLELLLHQPEDLVRFGFTTTTKRRARCVVKIKYTKGARQDLIRRVVLSRSTKGRRHDLRRVAVMIYEEPSSRSTKGSRDGLLRVAVTVYKRSSSRSTKGCHDLRRVVVTIYEGSSCVPAKTHTTPAHLDGVWVPLVSRQRSGLRRIATSPGPLQRRRLLVLVILALVLILVGVLVVVVVVDVDAVVVEVTACFEVVDPSPKV